jgi:hypothetical protein
MPKAKREPVNLTDFKVRALRPDPEGEYIQEDTQVPGFGVRVRPSGSAVNVVMKRLLGDTRVTRVTLGRVGEISLQEARENARGAAAAVRKGIDVNQEKRLALEARRAERGVAIRVRAETGYAPGSFGELATRYILAECNQLSRGAEVASVIRRQILPTWGERPVTGLRRRDLTALLDPVLSDGRVQAAHKLREVAIRIVN